MLNSFNSFSQTESICLSQKDSLGLFWAKDLGRKQISNFLQFSNKSISPNSNDSWIMAKGQTLEDIKEECTYIPSTVKNFEKCQELKDGLYYSYIRYSVDRNDCGKKKSKPNTQLLEIYNNYQKLKKDYKLKSTTKCFNTIDECNKIALELIYLNHKTEGIKLLEISCKNGDKKSCFLSYEYDNSLKESLKKSCILGYKIACAKLIKLSQNNEINIDKNFKSYFCKSGLNNYCDKNNASKENVDIFDNSIQPFEL